MNKALSASDLPLVMWLCGRLDPSAAPAALPQHILLCLVQQLGASDLLEDTVSHYITAEVCGGLFRCVWVSALWRRFRAERREDGYCLEEIVLIIE